jgi:riboflavin synthase
MFTGIIQAVGHIALREQRDGDQRLWIATPAGWLDDVGPGDSIAVSGVCLTVVTCEDARFGADVSRETLGLTTLGGLAQGRRVNLEKALRLADRLGGHLVSGHVDGLGEVTDIAEDARSQRWTVRAPAALLRYVATKGSITINGVSLTVNEVGDDTFGVNLIPHTVQHTDFQERRVGDMVNLEVDVVARYVERLCSRSSGQ